MSRFLSASAGRISPYTPGEQPQDMEYIKLNTNESPFAPSEKAAREMEKRMSRLRLYPDPETGELLKSAAAVIGAEPDELIAVNGSDEILNFCFAAFCDMDTPAVFPDVTYGFYPVAADYAGVPYRLIPLTEDMRINTADYANAGGTVFIANPNAPTGIALSVSEIEEIVKANPDNVVVVDEAYVDFGAESSVPLIHKYDNVVVTQTFSKSRSLAGIRLGFGIANRELIKDLNTIKYSTNPYNVNAMAQAAGIGAFADEEYTRANCRTIAETRDETSARMRDMGFILTDSKANFIFAKHAKVSGGDLYAELRKRGVLVRHFTGERVADYIRVTVGTREQMKAFTDALADILRAADGRKEENA